jgi:hypothetical protein
MATGQRPTPTVADDQFAWDNQRYESVFEAHTGIAPSLLDHGICLGLTLFGSGSVIAALVMAILHMFKF